MITAFRDGLRSHQELINRLNVYPVPDGDTGTNMALTLESVADELDRPRLARPRRHLPGHRPRLADGGPGQLRGHPLPAPAGHHRGPQLPDRSARARSSWPEALAIADELAHEAVMRPVEGTILTVARGAAEGAEPAAEAGQVAGGRGRGRPGGGGRRAGPDPVAPPGPGAGRRGRRRRDRLPAAVRRPALGGRRPGHAPAARARPTPCSARSTPRPRATAAAARPARRRAAEQALAGLRYEVMYLLEAPDETIPSFKEVWAGIGDSIVVVGGDGLWNCHIHTDDIGAAIEAALDAGRPRNIRVTDLLEQVEEERWVREAAGTVGSGPSADPAGSAADHRGGGRGHRRRHRAHLPLARASRA